MEKLDLFTVDEIVEKYRWRFAKSMPHIPHWYIVRKQKPSHNKLYHCDETEFVWFAKHIRKNGYKARYWKKMMTYFAHDGFKYWTMGAPIDETIIINRALIEKSPIE